MSVTAVRDPGWWGKAVLRAELAILRANRRRSRADYRCADRYAVGDRAALFAWCKEAGSDLLAFLRPGPIGAPVVATERVRRGPGGERDIVRFPSPLPSGIQPNDTVVAHRYRARGSSEGTIVFHHPGYCRDLEWLDWFTRPLRRRFDVVLMEAPFHLSRKSAGWFSGERLVNPNPRHLYEGIRQWMADHTALLAHLEALAASGDTGARPIGILGYSLGGYLSLLHAHFRPELPVASLACTNDYALGLYEGDLGEVLRVRIGELGFSRGDWEELTASIKLHLHAERIPADRVLLVSAIYERVEPFTSIERFHAVFPARRRVLLPVGHATLGLLCRGRVQREVLRFLDEVRVHR